MQDPVVAVSRCPLTAIGPLDYDAAAHFFQKAIKLSPTYYVKAHENLDRVNRLRGKDG
jgi:hypothetical protein